MTLQVPVAETTGTKAPIPADRIEEIVSVGFGTKKFIENFEALVEADGGTANVRQLVLQLAFQGRFTGNDRPLVPAKVRGTHAAMSVTKGREATSVTVSGGAALAVGPAEMLIPEGWDWVPLVSVARLESGHTPSRNHSDYWDGGLPWIGIRDAKAHNYGWIDSTEQTVSEKGLANSSARLLPAGTVCLSRTASVGYVTIMRRPMATSQDFVNWVCSERIHAEFLMQLLRCEVPVLRRFSKGAVHQTIYFPEVKAFHVSLPPLAEQKRIVAKLDQLMVLCDNLEARQIKKREVGTRLTKSALETLTTTEGPEEFDAAWKRVEKNFDILVDRAESVQQLRQSVLGLAVSGRLGAGVRGAELPAGWTWETIESVTSLVTDGEHLTPPRVAQGVPLVTAKNVRDGHMDFARTDFVEEATAEKCWRRCKPQIGDLLMVCVGATTGRLCVLREDVPFVLVRSVAVLRVETERMLPDFLAAVLRSPDGQRQIWAGVKEQAQPCLYLNRMNVIRIPCPPIRQQERIVAKVQQLMKVCDDLETTLRRAEDRAGELVKAAVEEMVA